MELMEPFTADPRALSPLPLAFLGDAVYELCARQAVAAMERPMSVKCTTEPSHL